ncbi:MAG: hypothetical protein AAGC69_23730 [Paracraurococcus sp.]
MPRWTRLADPATDAELLPAWFVQRMLGEPAGHFGLLLTTGDVLRVAGLRAAHIAEDGTILLDLLLDHAGVPALADLAWQSKHYLGAPVPGAVEATVNLAQVVCAVEFTGEASFSDKVVELRQAAEAAAERQEVA